MKIKLSDHAELDLKAGFSFYEARSAGIGNYFLDCLISDIDSLLITAGTHRRFQVSQSIVKAISVRDILSC